MKETMYGQEIEAAVAKAEAAKEATGTKDNRKCICGHSDLEHAYRKFVGYLHCELCSCSVFQAVTSEGN